MVIDPSDDQLQQPRGDAAERVVCVYCASSNACHPDFHSAAYRLGQLLASSRYSIVYGGGAIGSMGALADGALSVGGRVIGVIPQFMVDLEWEHPGIAELQRVEDMRTRKHLMLSRSQAVVALPGGVGTLEELLETITLKKLGFYPHPIILVNTRGFFGPLIELLRQAVEEKFMNQKHSAMWTVVDHPEQVLDAIQFAPTWPQHAINFAVAKAPDTQD
jgi:uncharacterized protein (TIGR00730 family)